MKVIYVLTFLVIYLEMIFKLVVLKSVGIVDIAYTLLFTTQIVFMLNLLCNIFKEKISKIILATSAIILTLYFIIQSKSNLFLKYNIYTNLIK